MIKLPKNIEWLREYIDLAKSQVPVHRLDKLYVISASTNRSHKIHGVLNELTGRPKSYDLGMYLMYQSYTVGEAGVSIELKAYSKIDILRTLAHELAHLKHWEHTPQHAILESKITVKFMKKLEKEGYVSEEDEYANN